MENLEQISPRSGLTSLQLGRKMACVMINYAARIAAGLRAERARQRRTRKSIAAQSGLSVGTVGRLENGERSATVEQLMALASALDVPATALLPELANVRAQRGAK
ncbi:helix-turn-helix domain-containing protein [Nocardia sp. NPDC059239]|uniref:helix-turn-helix domain-containing protein n=1 Tax=unclassified Nocardia TaxID=2637762 RepID=UPI00368071FD